MTRGKLGIVGLLGINYYVRNLERSRRFYLDMMDFAEIGKSSLALERAGRQTSRVFQAGEAIVVCSTPRGEGGRAHRYLSKHPDGVGTIGFEVEDIQHTFAELERSGGTPITDVQKFQDDTGSIETFSITTPFGDTTFRFAQRSAGFNSPFGGMERYPKPMGGSNATGLTHVDHITSNFQTMAPTLLWLEHVMGFEPLWEIAFHTKDVTGYGTSEGSGLRSKVMWDPSSGVRFANNEPARPAFKASQINVFNEQHRGDGVQHIALATTNILNAVERLRAKGVQFMPVPHAYYEKLPKRLADLGITIDESVRDLERLEVLVDGVGPGKYLLQLFLKESAGLYGTPGAGPFFYEIIQRKGDEGFGAGNFRALFESIETDQQQKTGQA